MRVALPDRPGSLGAVATALGSAGADIQSVEIVQRAGNMVVDDFLLALPPGAFPDELLSACHELDGVDVLWISRSPSGSLVTDVAVLEEMLIEPALADRVLVDAAPRLFHASWAMLLSGDRARLATANAPEPASAVRDVLNGSDRAGQLDLAADWLPGWPETTIAVVPLPGQAEEFAVVGRQGGPEFFDSEVARLRHLVSLVPVPAR